MASVRFSPLLQFPSPVCVGGEAGGKGRSLHHIRSLLTFANHGAELPGSWGNRVGARSGSVYEGLLLPKLTTHDLNSTGT